MSYSLTTITVDMATWIFTVNTIIPFGSEARTVSARAFYIFAKEIFLFLLTASDVCRGAVNMCLLVNDADINACFELQYVDSNIFV